LRNRESLRKIQRDIASKVIIQDKFRSPPSIVAGVDLAFLEDDGIAACAAMDYPPRQLIESKQTVIQLTCPYIPTFLAFREGPAILEVISSMRSNIDVLLVNGQGIAHPLRCGLASHVGVVNKLPTIGVASSRLVGEYDVPQKEGEATLLEDQGDRVGWVLKSRLRSKPIFISPGHLIGLDTSLRIVKNCIQGNRLPEPLQMAHYYANRVKRELEPGRT